MTNAKLICEALGLVCLIAMAVEDRTLHCNLINHSAAPKFFELLEPRAIGLPDLGDPAVAWRKGLWGRRALD